MYLLKLRSNINEGIKNLLAHFKRAAQNIQSPVLELKKGFHFRKKTS